MVFRKKRLWDKYYTKEEKNFKVPEYSMYDYLKFSNEDKKNETAINYFGHKFSFAALFSEIDKVADAYRTLGVAEKDVVTIIMPNMPEAIISIYALNKIGAIANMVHPLSGEEEIKFCIRDTNSKIVLIIDNVAEKLLNIIDDTNVEKVIISSASDSMPFFMGLLYEMKDGYKINRPRSNEVYMSYKEFLRKGSNNTFLYKKQAKDKVAIIMHSGGTTGTPKSIQLTNANFNSLARQIGLKFRTTKEKVMAILPIFHSFGLGVTIHGPLILGYEVILIPRFNSRNFNKTLMFYRPTIITGVPTLFEAMVKNKKMKERALSQIKVLVSGGDNLSDKTVEEIEDFLKKNGSSGRLEKGYGLTEACAAVIATMDAPRGKNNIGIPLPGNDVCFVKPGTSEEVKIGEDGEICICGPTVMKGYLNNEKENNETLQVHDDGKLWLHTGDIGKIDEEGLIYYVQRLKRMIITSGYNVYPIQIEKAIESHESVDTCVVIGIPHPYKVEVPKAIIVLKEGFKGDLKLRRELRKLCEKSLAKYAVPKKYEFRDYLPQTKMGKIDFNALKNEK